MKKMNRILSVILTVTMLVTMLPAAAFAVETDGKYEAESVEEADAASGQKADQEASVDEAGEKEAKNEEVQNEVDSELKDDGSDEARKAQDPAAEETGNAEEADKAESSEEKNVTSLVKEEKDYVVTVTYGDDAEVPPYAKIRVEEVKAKDDPDLYDSYVAQAAEAVKSEVEDLSYVKLLDISIVDKNDKEVDLQGNVDVQIRLKDVEEAEDTTQVVHFEGEEEEPVVMETEVNGDTLAFETEGFSVYAVVNTDSTSHRLAVEFYEKPSTVTTGNAVWKTIYVKKEDILDDAEFKEILYDPGAPDASTVSGKVFAGWIREDAGSATTERDIDGIREDVKTLLNGTVADGQKISYYPVYKDAYRLYYEDENGDVYFTDTVFKKENGTDTTAEIIEDYMPVSKTPESKFLFWVEKGSDPAQADTPKYRNESSDSGDIYKHTIILTKDVTLTPYLKNGYRVIFDANDGDTGEASYTETGYYAYDEFPEEPGTEPERRSYDFTGWYTDETCTNKFIKSLLAYGW